MSHVAYDDPGWITGKDVAVMAGVTHATVRSWIHRGYGPPYYRIVRSVRYKRAEVQAWLDGTRHEPRKAS
jgi:excisionase family DNA binding protein